MAQWARRHKRRGYDPYFMLSGLRTAGTAVADDTADGAGGEPIGASQDAAAPLTPAEFMQQLLSVTGAFGAALHAIRDTDALELHLFFNDETIRRYEVDRSEFQDLRGIVSQIQAHVEGQQGGGDPGGRLVLGGSGT